MWAGEFRPNCHANERDWAIPSPFRPSPGVWQRQAAFAIGCAHEARRQRGSRASVLAGGGLPGEVIAGRTSSIQGPVQGGPGTAQLREVRALGSRERRGKPDEVRSHSRPGMPGAQERQRGGPLVRGPISPASSRAPPPPLIEARRWWTKAQPHRAGFQELLAARKRYDRRAGPQGLGRGSTRRTRDRSRRGRDGAADSRWVPALRASGGASRDRQRPVAHRARRLGRKGSFRASQVARAGACDHDMFFAGGDRAVSGRGC